LRSNPDGDVEIPDAPYSTFRYPPCPVCARKNKEEGKLADGGVMKIEVDEDGAWLPSSNAGILKPAVIMFGESIPSEVKTAAEEAIDEAGRVLVMGSSLATYSAFRLIKRAKENGMPIGVLNLGGIRGEEELYDGIPNGNKGQHGARCSQSSEKLLPGLLEKIRAWKG
jgi:NAD-dependent deacetylase sirtuin 4